MAAGLNIVLVEDDADLRRMLVNVLRDDGHRVSAHASVEDMLEHADMIDVEVYLIDINLPGEDGLSLVNRLRRVPTHADIVMLTARHDLGSRVQGYDVGADLYLVKPVQPVELVAVLRRIARRRGDARAGEVRPIALSNQWLSGELGEVRLTLDEAVLLTALARAPMGKLETWQLVSLLELDAQDGGKAGLVIRIARLRKKLLQVGAGAMPIRSLYGYGYQLSVPVVL